MKKGEVELFKETESGENKFLSLRIDGDWYTLWGTLPEGISKGKEVVYSYRTKKREDKEFRNITEIYPLNGNQAPEVRKSKTVALKAAGRLASTSEREIKAPELIRTAEKLEYWLRGENDGSN